MLTDLEGIAPCLPGAQLTGVDGDVYMGKVKIKVGPVISEYAGTARFARRTTRPTTRSSTPRARTRAAPGNATAVINAQLQADGDRTIVTVTPT